MKAQILDSWTEVFFKEVNEKIKNLESRIYALEEESDNRYPETNDKIDASENEKPEIPKENDYK